MCSSTLSLTWRLGGMGGQRHASVALPTRRTRYPLYRKLSVPQGRSGRLRKILPNRDFFFFTKIGVLGARVFSHCLRAFADRMLSQIAWQQQSHCSVYFATRDCRPLVVI